MADTVPRLLTAIEADPVRSAAWRRLWDALLFSDLADALERAEPDAARDTMLQKNVAQANQQGGSEEGRTDARS